MCFGFDLPRPVCGRDRHGRHKLHGGRFSLRPEQRRGQHMVRADQHPRPARHGIPSHRRRKSFLSGRRHEPWQLRFHSLRHRRHGTAYAEFRHVHQRHSFTTPFCSRSPTSAQWTQRERRIIISRVLATLSAIKTPPSFVAWPSFTRKNPASGYQLGIARNSNTSSDWVFDTTQRNTNDVLFIVASYDYDSHTANLWIDPSASTFGAATAPTPTITATAGSDLNTSGIHAFVLGCRTNAPPACLVDDLRIGTAWALVTGGLAFGTQPLDQTLNAGTTAAFSVTASGAPTLDLSMAKKWRHSSGRHKIFRHEHGRLVHQ